MPFIIGFLTGSAIAYFLVVFAFNLLVIIWLALRQAWKMVKAVIGLVPKAYHAINKLFVYKERPLDEYRRPTPYILP